MRSLNAALNEYDAKQCQADEFTKLIEELAPRIEEEVLEKGYLKQDPKLNLDRVVGDNNAELSPFIIAVGQAVDVFEMIEAAKELNKKFKSCVQEDSKDWAEMIIEELIAEVAA